MSNPLMEKMLGLPEFEVTDFKQSNKERAISGLTTTKLEEPVFMIF